MYDCLCFGKLVAVVRHPPAFELTVDTLNQILFFARLGELNRAFVVEAGNNVFESIDGVALDQELQMLWWE